jgi:tetratricopeptide (TPR) repeat protein
MFILGLTMKPKKLAVLLALLLLAPLAADAKPPKKKPKPKPGQEGQQQPATPQGEPARIEQAPPPGLDVEDKLWHFQTSDARGTVNRFADQADKNAFVAMAMGRVLEQEKSYGEAASRLQKAAEMLPADPAPLVYLGEVYLRQRNDGAAADAFRKAADLARSRGGDGAYYLGVAQLRLRQYDEAISSLQGARAPQPALVPYQIGLARIYQENWGGAAEQLSRAIDTDSGFAYAYYYRGLAQDKLGRKDLLVNDMERFLALAPNAPEAERAKAILRAVKH